jgi:Mn2+/Fe2+ NRAMP family transporter
MATVRGWAWGLPRSIGPGLAMAATGVGAGDLMAAMLAGADFGLALAWAVVAGAVLKLALNEGIARWQLATGTTLLEGWCRHLGRFFQAYLVVYLTVWGFVVAAGLMSACGVAAHALMPGLSIRGWAVAHSLGALALVLAGRYRLFEAVMKGLVAVMGATLLASAALVAADLGALRGLTPGLPSGSPAVVLSLVGGVGGSVTLLSYGYWIRERGWAGCGRLSDVRVDLAVGYVMTALIAVSMLVVAAGVLAGGGGMPEGSAGLVTCGDAIGRAAAARLGPAAGEAGRLVFLLGVWGAVASSILGVWQGVPYLFADFVHALSGGSGRDVDVRSWTYRGFLLFLALPPMALLALDRPVWVIRLYTVTGALFMPVLAASLLWLGSRARLVGALRNGRLSTAVLALSLLLFAVLAARELADLL